MKRFLAGLLIALCFVVPHAQAFESLGTLGTAKTATTNPAPSTLGTVSPYDGANAGFTQVGTAWTTQTATYSKALFPGDNEKAKRVSRVKVWFVPSGGAAITYTVIVWQYNKTSGTWIKPYNLASNSYTGPASDYILNPGTDPIWFELSSISAGTISIYYDSEVAQAY